MPQTKERRRATAKILIEQRKARTPQQQLEKLNAMFGVGKGAQKERNRLIKMAAMLLFPFFLFSQNSTTQATLDYDGGSLIIVKCPLPSGPCDEQAYCITDTKRVWLDADSYSSSPGAKWSSPSQIRGAYPHHSWTVELWETQPIQQITYTIWAEGHNESTNKPVSIWLKCRKTREGDKNHFDLLEATVMQE